MVFFGEFVLLRFLYVGNKNNLDGIGRKTQKLLIAVARGKHLFDTSGFERQEKKVMFGTLGV